MATVSGFGVADSRSERPEGDLDTVATSGIIGAEEDGSVRDDDPI